MEKTLEKSQMANEYRYCDNTLKPIQEQPIDGNAALSHTDCCQPDEGKAIEFNFSTIDHPVAPASDVKELPIWGLPSLLQEVVDEVANGYQCSRDYVVASMMVAASTMIGKRVTYKFNNHVNYPTLWIAIVGRTASGKTAPLQFFFRHIELMEREAFRQYQTELQAWNDANEAKGPRPVFKHVLLNNPSDESVLHELSTNGSLTWKTDELRTMFDSWGKYSKNGGGTILGNLLSIHNNGDVSITRVTSEPIYIAEPNLNIIGGIQPQLLKKVMENRGFTEDGLFQRFLYVYPEAHDIPLFADVTISSHSSEVWQVTLDNLAHVSNHTLTETESAKQLHIDAINRWRGECNVFYHDVDAMVSLVQKMEIHLCRWSIVVAVLKGEREITYDIMRYSVECMEYFKLCGEKAFCLIANSDSRQLSKGDVFKQLKTWYADLNQSLLGKALGISQQAVSKLLS